MDPIYEKQVNEAAEYLSPRIKQGPRLCIIFGTGLSEYFLSHAKILAEAPYESIPHFKPAQIESHPGKLVKAQLNGIEILALCGRFHLYEGYAMQEVVFPVHVVKNLGITTLITVSAVGGLCKDQDPGDLMLVTDHINFTGLDPLIGYPHAFLNAAGIYDQDLVNAARSSAKKQGIALPSGTMLFLTGPCFETIAESAAARQMGASTIGWSTVPESVVAHYLGIRVLAIHCITDISHPERMAHKELTSIIDIAQSKSAETLYHLIADLIPHIQDSDGKKLARK